MKALARARRPSWQRCQLVRPLAGAHLLNLATHRRLSGGGETARYYGWLVHNRRRLARLQQSLPLHQRGPRIIRWIRVPLLRLNANVQKEQLPEVDPPGLLRLRRCLPALTTAVHFLYRAMPVGATRTDEICPLNVYKRDGGNTDCSSTASRRSICTIFRRSSSTTLTTSYHGATKATSDAWF